MFIKSIIQIKNVNMIKQGKTQSQKIVMFSKDISSLPSSAEVKNQLPTIEEDVIHPRVFPDNKIPLKVAITRKTKSFQQFDLNAILKNIDWKYGKGLLELVHYNYQNNYAVEQCTPQRLQKKLIKGRALDSSSKNFRQFIVTQVISLVNYSTLKGFFRQNPNKVVQINKFYVCLSFENPKIFSKTILQAQQNREYFLSTARFNFYVDNLDLQQAPQVPKLVLNRITKLIGIEFLNREFYREVNNHFRRTMNEILFSHVVLNDPHKNIERVCLRQKRKINQHNPKNRIITLFKDGKKFKLTLKSLKTKIEQVQSKTIFFKDQIVFLIHQIKGKLQKIFDYQIFDLKQELFVIDRFIADNMLMVDYFLHFIDENVIGYIADIIRNSLIDHSDGWFKIYETDKNTYLLSKLRRFFIFIQQNIKSIIKNHIQSQVVRYCQCLKKRLPIQISFKSFKQYVLIFQHTRQNQISYPPIISISCTIGFNNFQMAIKKQKIVDMLNKNVLYIFKKLQSINTPQNKALIQIYAIFKDQYGIDIELPTGKQKRSHSQHIKINKFQLDWISDQFQILNQTIGKSVATLQTIENKLLEISNQIKLKQILNDQNYNLNVKHIVQKINLFNNLYDKLQDYFQGEGINYGLYFIDYKPAKDQLRQLILKKIGAYKMLLVRQYQIASTEIQNQLKKLIQQISKRPQNIYQLVSQRDRINSLQSIILSYKQKNQAELYNLCENFKCIMPRSDIERRWLNMQKVTTVFQIKTNKVKQYNEIKKDIVEKIKRQKDEIVQILNLFQVTLEKIKQSSARDLYQQNFSKLEYLNEKHLSLKSQIHDIRYKQQHLLLEAENFDLFLKIQQDFLILFTIWQTTFKWETHKNIWYFKEFSQFEIMKPDITITQMISNIKKIEKSKKSNYSIQLYQMIMNVKKQIQIFQDKHLRLLKLLKKDGFNIKHLQKIGIYIDFPINKLSLQQAIDLNFLDMIQQIQAVSNDAWNQFYLDQTLNRVQDQLLAMKYELIFYLDKKGNQIPLVNNYASLNEKIQQVILDLQSVQYNPMKGNFEKKIQELLQKSIYISKSLQNCQIFQKKFVEVHPIFDSTDVVKQLPVENRLFTKILRNWIELLKYFKKIVSVYDACNGQNIAQKMQFLINNIENIKVGLSNYLQKKRQGFNRFYLLTDQQLYELFASTNDMKILSKHISKLFHSINDLQFDDESINSLISLNTNFSLRIKVQYKKQNLEEWLNRLERSIKQSLNYQFENIYKNNNKWSSILNFQCSQILLMCYELQKSQQLMTYIDFVSLQKKQRNFIRNLVDIKKKSNLTIEQSINLGSLLVLALYFSEKLSFLKVNNIADPQNFQIKKMLKICYKEQQIKIISFETQISYGFEYLGLVKRLVLTNLTQRMQLIYMSAIKYSLGGSAIGPAGTGKSQTTKDIARICGKNCIIYNCSESLNMQILTRILKGMAVTGLWICLDQFNRLYYQVLNMISQQLSIIFKYKAIGSKLDVQYDREIINLKPDFHLCITYNPTYLGRQNIPNSVQKQFRIVAMVNCDKKMICKLLFYTKGFKQADLLSQNLTKLFEYCQSLWYRFSLYDFGLRSLISIIELTAIIYKGEGNGQLQVFQSIKTLVYPRLSANHRSIMEAQSRKIFKDTLFQKDVNTVQAYIKQIQNILSVRLGIILLGDIFSNKSTTMRGFEQTYKEYRIEQIYINTLSIQQIYGETNSTTRIFKDGYLTKKLREYINNNPKEKLIIYIKGIIFPDWIENLNSVLDNTRSLSLPSGQILWIPDKIKFIINCTHLEFASPATISRSCIVSYKAKSCKQLIKCSQDKENLRNKIYDRYQIIVKQLRQHILFQIDQRLIIHWVNKYLAKTKFILTLQAFTHVLSILFEGLLDEYGKKLFNNRMKSYFQFEGDIFDNYWDGKIWKKIKEFQPNTTQIDYMQQAYVGDLIIKDSKYYKISFINKTYFRNKGGLQDILLLIGNQNIGKSSIVSDIYSKSDKKLIQYNKINLTRKINNVQLYNSISIMLNKKSNKRKGMIHGKQLFILLDDIHLPQKNKYQFKNVIQFLTLLISKKGCYNYDNLQFQYLQDIYLIGNNNLNKRQLNLRQTFLKQILPIFVKPYQIEQINEIFSQIINHQLHNQQGLNIYLQNSSKLVKIISPIVQLSQKQLPKHFRFEFIHFRKILTSILLWKLNQQYNKELVIPQIFAFQILRTLLSRIQNASAIKKIQSLINSQFINNKQHQVYFHSFQKSENGTGISPKNCNRITQLSQFIRQIQYLCDQYMLHSDNPNYGFVVFPQLCILVCRISRGFLLKNGHISIVGLPKCGKKVIVQLCNYLIHGKIYRMSDHYEQKIWSQIIKNSTKQSIINKTSSVLLIQHHQLKQNIQKEQLNTLLKTSLLPHVYSEADYQQLTYLFQSQLIKTHQAVNKQNTIKLFTNFLSENLHIVLLFNPIMKDFKENFIYYPAILKKTEFYWITQWPTEALQMIAAQAIVQSELEPYKSIFPKIHKICKQETLSKAKILHWEGLYLDLLKCFQTIYEERQVYLKNKQQLLKKSFNIIKQTQLKLEATRDQIKKLQPAILILQKQTIKTIKTLNIQKANAQSVNQQLVKKEAQCQKVIIQANAVKIKLEITNQKVEQDLKKAWENVYLVKQNHIAQIKSLINPSQLIKIVITAIVIVLNQGQFQIIRVKSEDGLYFEQNYFETGKRYILSKDSKSITKLLTDYNKQKLTKQKIALIEEKCLNHPRWNIVQAKSANKAVFYFFLWIEAVVKYFKLFQETVPMRQQLAKTTQIYEQRSKEIDIVKKELRVYEIKIKQLIITHKQKTEKLTEYTNQIKLYEKMLTRGYEILKQIQTQKAKWQQYEQQIAEKFKQNAGNSIISSTLITYLSPHTKQSRNHIINLLKAELQNTLISYNSENIFWIMQSQQKIILKQMGIYDDDYVLNNLKIVQKTYKTAFIVDPEQQGLKHMKNKYKTQGIMFVLKIDYHNKLFKKTVQRALNEGSIVFVQLSGLELPYLIQQLINPTFKKNQSNGLTQILFNQKSIYYNQNFKLYLFTTSLKQDTEYSIQLISKVTTINFSITPNQLEEHIISTIISLQFPQQNEQLNEINKMNIKDNIELKNIEDKILNIFATMDSCEQILKTEDLLQILSTSNRLYSQIKLRIQDSNNKKKGLNSRRQHYRTKGQKMSKLYFQIKKLTNVSTFYQYSFSWFINLLRQNLHNFRDILLLQLCKGLTTDQKIIAPLLIAQSQFPNIPFYKLFNYQSEDNEYIQQRYHLIVSKLRLARIVSNIRQSNIQNLDVMVRQYPQKFTPVLNANAQDILQSIPDEFSTLQFFEKITLINCFRPDCTLKLLKEWLEINLGTSFKSDPSKLLQNTASNKPILVFQNSNTLKPSSQMIYKLFDTHFIETGKSICYINSNRCTLDRVKILIQSGITNDQWIVLEGLGQQSGEINEEIINLIEEGDFKKKDVFRFWIIVNEYQLIKVRDKLIKMSNKIIFEDEIPITKKISSFFMSESKKLQSFSSNMELNKKKYMLHELIIFHYMLTQKSRYKQKQWNNPINFSQDDLELNIKYLYFASPQQLRKLYPNIIANIIYGGKITDQKDIQTISLHIEQIIKNMIMDKGIFWQTVWADDKFPKSQQEYEIYLKSIFNKNVLSFKSIYEQYGITSFVTNFIKQKEHRQIMQFYNKSKYLNNKNDILSQVKVKLQQIYKMISRKLALVIISFEAHKKNIFYNFLIDQQEYYKKKLNFIMGDVKYYLQLESIFNRNQENWCFDIMNNKIPTPWEISTINSLQSWVNLFLQGFEASFKINYEDQNHSEQIKTSSLNRIYTLEYCHHFSTFCSQIFSVNKCSAVSHSLIWETQKMDHISPNIGVKVDRWYLWNAIFEKHIMPLREGTIQLNYYSVLPTGILTVIGNQQLKKINNYCQILVYHNSFQYGDNPSPIIQLFMPVEKNDDPQWIKRMRVHLTLAL